MTGCYEHNSSPSITGRGGDGANQWPAHSASKRSTKYFSNRWNLWARWSYRGFAQTVTNSCTHDFFRQRFGCDSGRKQNQRSTLNHCSRQFCADGSVRPSRICRWNFIGPRNQFTTSRRGTSGIFISSRRSARYANEYRSRFDGSPVVRAGAARGNHTRD